jgi:hypothetical protein
MYFEAHHVVPPRRREAGTTFEQAAYGELGPMVVTAAFIILLGLFNERIVSGILAFAIPPGF